MANDPQSVRSPGSEGERINSMDSDRQNNSTPDSALPASDLGLGTSDTSAGTPDPGPRTRLFLASSNPGKLREFRAAAALRGVTVEPLPEFSQLPVCLEDGTTFEANARKKAIHYSRNSSRLVFADDSGICVDALDGAPGIFSARFAGPQATDEQNNARLLAEIHRTEAQRRALTEANWQLREMPNRGAHYVCAIALAKSGQVITVVEGRAAGEIIDHPRGSGGFGYDPYFLHPALGKTFAEMPPEEKFAVSHRGIAFRKLLDYLCLNFDGESASPAAP